MLLRIRREIFRAGEFESYEIDDCSFREDVCKKYHLDIANTEFYDDTGALLKEDVFCGYSMLTAVQKPAALSTVAIVAASVALVAVGVAIGVYLYKQKHSNNAKVTYSNSLRGAQNPMRAGGPVGILFGNYRVPLDMAGMVYSSVRNNKQFVHQLFCAGYRPIALSGSPFYNDNCGVVLRKDTSQAGGVPVYGGAGNPQSYKAWIGDTPFGSVANYISISASEEHPAIQDFPYYNKRCIEDSLSLKLLNADTSKGGSTDNILKYQAPSGCVRIGVGISAPYGYYMLNNDGNQEATLMSYLIQCRKVGTSSWYTIKRMHSNMNVNEYREVHYKTLTDFSDFSINDRYEVRILMDDGSAWHTESKYNTAMLVEFIQYDTVNPARYPNLDASLPVNNSTQYELVDLKAQATDKLTGYIDQFYVECYLQCRAYTGNGQETSNYWNSWTVPSTSIAESTRIEMMSNPASVLLYLLTNKNVNPRALSWDEAKEKIDWVTFREWYLFCASKGWTCNAWITDQMLIGKLCDLVCATGRATFRTVNGKYSVLLACATSVVTQMFTPRNAWDMQMNKSFEKPLDAVKVEFVDESTWSSAERTAYVQDGTVVVDEDITDIEDQLTVESFAIWGVTRPKQIADLEAYQLLQRRLQVRTYAWKCSLEGLMCSVGDVIYMANDNFLYSLGYGRIKSLKIEGGSVVGVYVDESVGVESGHSYGITVRLNNGEFATYPISAISTDTDTFTEGVLLYLATPIPAATADVTAGNLFMYGDSSVEGKKLLITNIQYDGDRNANIEAVDYIPEIFQALDSSSWVVPAYVSGISKYGSGVSFAKGAVPPVINNPPTSVYPTDLNIGGLVQGVIHEVEYALSTSPTVPPAGDEAKWGYTESDAYGALEDTVTEDEFDYGLVDVFGWGSNYDNWYKGLYVWQRIKSTYTDENGIETVIFSDPVYCSDITQSLINGCSLSVVLTDSDGDGDTHTWERDARSSSNVSVIFKVQSRRYANVSAFEAALSAGGSVEIIAYKNSAVVQSLIPPVPTTEYDSNTKTATLTYSLSFAKNMPIDSLVINAATKDSYYDVTGATYDVVTKASETLNAVDNTMQVCNLGALSFLPEGIYDCSDGKRYYRIQDIPAVILILEEYSLNDGDFFIVERTFGVGATQVTPVGSENPKAEGWYYATNGSFYPTEDTTVISGNTYYTVSTVYTVGFPYELTAGGTSWVTMEATAQKFDQMLGCLATVLDNPSIQPNDGPVYGWFKNLTALQAIIKYLTVGNITIDRDVLGSDGNLHNFKFLAHTYAEDGSLLTVPKFDVVYDGVNLLTVDVLSGTVTMRNANVSGSFSSEGFATQDASATYPLSNVGVTTPNVFNMYNFHLAAISSLHSHVTYIQTSSSEYSRSFYSDTSGAYRGSSYIRIGLAGDPNLTYASIQSTSFNVANPFSGVGVYLLENHIYFVSTPNNGACLVYVDNYYRGKENLILGRVQSVAANILGVWSGSTQITATNISDVFSSYFPRNSSLCSVEFASAVVWSSTVNDGLYYYNLSTIAMNPTYCSFTGTVQINGSTVINTSTANQYFIKKESLKIYISNSSNVLLYTISEYNSVPWLLNISVAAGVSGIKAKNVLPFDSSSSSVGTSALPFAEGHFKEGAFDKVTTANAQITGGNIAVPYLYRLVSSMYVPVLDTKTGFYEQSIVHNSSLADIDIGTLGIAVGSKTGYYSVLLPSGGRWCYAIVSCNCYYNGSGGVHTYVGESAGGTQFTLGNSDAGKPYAVLILYWKVQN